MEALLWICVITSCLVYQTQAVYYGTKIGEFATRFHQVKGEVYAVDSRTLFIKVCTVIDPF